MFAIDGPSSLVCSVRMQTYYPGGSPYSSTRHAFATIWKEGANKITGGSKLEVVRGGLKSMYRGVSATTMRGIVLSTSQICSYDQIKQMIKTKKLMNEGFGLHLTSSLFAGYAVVVCVVRSAR